MTEQIKVDFLIIGSGIAGLYTAIRAAAHGTVLLVTKGGLLESNTWHAQGGVAAALGREDSAQAHFIDTLQAGAGLCLKDAVSILVSDGPQRILDLISLGTRFDRSPSGELLLGREAAHSQRRIVHARGDGTGAEIAETLATYAKHTANLQVKEGCLALQLQIQQGYCTGASLYQDGNLIHCLARATVLATGGCGQVFKYTTNPDVATGDGFAMAARAGARLKDMEFIQFHPTALAINENPMPLISEAVRGEGAILVNEQGERFMPAIHKWAELAPRNVVARAIFHQMQAGHKVYLDATMLGERFPIRFPTIFRLCQERGLDPRHQQIPVAPSAHFIMGGIQADTVGRTSIPGLFACGEVACTGVHGANRLASNSLLEGLVFAERVAQTLPTEVVPSGVSGAGAGGGEGASDGPISLQLSVPKPGTNSEELANNVATQVRNIMWNYAGIVRTGEGLDKARQELETLMASEASRLYPVANLLETAMLIVQSANARQESRGGHYRSDYPTENDEWAVRHVITSHNGCTVMQNGALARVNS